jgi:hypothetical protein
MHSDPRRVDGDGCDPFIAADQCVGKGEMLICDVKRYEPMSGGNTGFPYCGSFEEMNANARLIAAAPELLAALKNLMPLWDRDDVRDGYAAEFTAAEDAIAKAEGKEA